MPSEPLKTEVVYAGQLAAKMPTDIRPESAYGRETGGLIEQLDFLDVRLAELERVLQPVLLDAPTAGDPGEAVGEFVVRSAAAEWVHQRVVHAERLNRHVIDLINRIDL